jgi:hypothetical protein
VSVCVVAQYPWSAIRTLSEGEPPGAIVCSDTRIISGRRVIPWLCSKQEPMGKNILVCYTSNNATATIFGLSRVRTDWNLTRIGESVRTVHKTFGGFSELLAVVSRKAQPPSILELMPPEYDPHPLTGIVGIGDGDVLRWFRDNFVPDPTPALLAGRPPQEAIDSLARQFGQPIRLPPITYPIEQAALSVVAALSEAIRVAGGPTVSLPVQVMTASASHLQAWNVHSTADLKTWEKVTAEREDVRIPGGDPQRANQFVGARSATQLFP